MDSNLFSKYKCYICKNLPESNVYECKNRHKICNRCFTAQSGICNCFEAVTKSVENPLLKDLNKGTNNNQVINATPCKFKDLGCTWCFDEDGMIQHVKECKFRLFNCIGSTLGIWSCEWKGQPSSILNHFSEQHEYVGEPFTVFQDANVQFDDEKSVVTINLINAFNKYFVFYYHSDAVKEVVYFAIILIGLKANAENFFYEFIIKSPSESNRKIKFVENIVNDCIPIEELIASGRCVSIPYAVIRNHLENNSIYFRFVVKKKDIDIDSPKPIFITQKSGDEKSKNKVPLNSKPKLKLSSFPNRGVMRTNNSKKSSSVPNSPSGGGGAGKLAPTHNRIEFVPILIRSTHSAELPDYTSINKVKVTDGLCNVPGMVETPFLTPSINKMYALEEQFKRDFKIGLDQRSGMSQIGMVDMTHMTSSCSTKGPYTSTQVSYKQSDSNKKYLDGKEKSLNSKYKK